MSYRNKTYVGFDADTDMSYYRLMQAWKHNKNIEFNFFNVHDLNPNPSLISEISIKRQLRERFKNTKVFILLVGANTRYLYKYVRWEINEAIEQDLPIIVVNISKKRKLDEDLCPPIIRNKLAIHISFNIAIVQYALDNWPDSHKQHRKNGEDGAYYYESNVYRNMGI